MLGYSRGYRETRCIPVLYRPKVVEVKCSSKLLAARDSPVLHIPHRLIARHLKGYSAQNVSHVVYIFFFGYPSYCLSKLLKYHADEEDSRPGRTRRTNYRRFGHSAKYPEKSDGFKDQACIRAQELLLDCVYVRWHD